MRSRSPWTDRRGRIDPLRAAACLAAAASAVWIASGLATARSAVEALDDTIHRTGEWALYFLLATLAVTPLKRVLAWPRLAVLRRVLGVTAFCFAGVHLGLYIADQAGDLAVVVAEIVTRFYLTIGFVALAGMAALAATSFDAAIRRLGHRWKRLHLSVHPLMVLALTHAFLQSPTDISEPTLLAGLYVGLLLHRLPATGRLPAGAVPRVLATAVVAGLATAALEYAWYATMTGVAAWRVLQANLDLALQPRPMWIAMALLALPLALRWVLPIARLRPAAGAPLPAGADARPQVPTDRATGVRRRFVR